MVLAAIVVMSGGCTAGRFRYDKLAKKDANVEMRDLEDLIRDSGPEGLTGEVKVEQLDYDFTAERDEYRLGKNDVLNIFVLNHPELSSQRVELGQISGTTIRKDGKIHLPVVGALQAEGSTLTEFEERLRTEIARYVVDPQVSVEILRHESQKFYVLGGVLKPGAFPVDGDTTLLEALGMAGGVPPDVDLESATVVRNGELLPINLGDLLRRGDVSRNIYMRGGDLIYVPDNVGKNVYVLGEVQRPGVVPIQRGGRVSLGEALAVAGGPTPAKARREIAVLRGGFAKPIVYRVDLDKALMYDEAIALRPGDRVVVAPTGLSTASEYMKQILPFLLGAQALGLAAQGGGNIAGAVSAIGAGN